MINIPITNLETAKLVSQKLYELSVPLSVRDTNNVTTYFCPWQELNNVTYLRFPETFNLYIHSQADETILDEVLQEFISASDINNLHLVINSKKGNYLDLSTIIPSYWLNNAVPDSAFEEQEQDLLPVDVPDLL